jgi:hypothetical protein
MPFVCYNTRHSYLVDYEIIKQKIKQRKNMKIQNKESEKYERRLVK